MEEQKEFRIKITLDDDIKKTIDTIKSTSSSALFSIGEPKIVITENGEKEIIVPYIEPTIDEEVKRR